MWVNGMQVNIMEKVRYHIHQGSFTPEVGAKAKRKVYLKSKIVAQTKNIRQILRMMWNNAILKRKSHLGLRHP